jgi:broad specificity phosphatase PhoE
MSEIYLIRHGQASFGEENYDRLSPIGVLQAKILARHLAKTDKIFDAVFYGTLDRQQKTAREFIDHYKENELLVSRPIISRAFNEYDSTAVWQALVPELSREDSSVENDLARMDREKKAFQRVFSKIMNRWVAGRYEVAGIPSWKDFKHGVNQGLSDLITRYGSRKRIAVFTSGGPISVTVQAALELSDQKTLEVSWQLMNASVTRIKYNPHGMMLAVFNDVTHLELEGDERLLTYR